MQQKNVTPEREAVLARNLHYPVVLLGCLGEMAAGREPLNDAVGEAGLAEESPSGVSPTADGAQGVGES
jgi:hypothetical protein